MQLINQPPEQLKQTPHIVAFLDFLGAEQKMRTPHESEIFLTTIQKIYDSAMDVISLNNAFTKDIVKVQIFSDNIVLAKEYEGDLTFQKCQDIFYICSTLQMCALAEKAPLRGAITHGNFCKSKLFVYGEALVKAYEMESSIAIYPRIIVDKSIISISGEMQQFKRYGLTTNLLKQASDGEWFVNYMFFKLPSGNCSLSLNMLKLMKQGILSGFMRKNQSPKVIQKYCWLANNFNDFCTECEYNDQKIRLNANGEPLAEELTAIPAKEIDK